MIEVDTEQKMIETGRKLGALFVGGEVMELVGDVGAGKTTLVRGIAQGMGVEETVQSPSFTISRQYDGKNGLRLAHYDFYRLEQAGIMSEELSDVLGDNKTAVVIEWSDTVKNVLPSDRLVISIAAISDTARRLSFSAGGEKSRQLAEGME